MGSTFMDAEFQVPGATTPAAVLSASLEFFGLSGSLGRFEAPAQSAGSPLSFLGVVFEDTVVARVRIVSGRAPLGAGVKDLSDGGPQDLVVMDDFLYSEPVAR